ncbi:MAG: Serine/threonine-protein kinase PknD [bacterium]|nr:Serine/threonine-protein kinase PknD [bacterium]
MLTAWQSLVAEVVSASQQHGMSNEPQTKIMPLEVDNLTRVVDILKTLGKVYLSKNQYREAAGKFEDILRLGVQDPEVYRNLAIALAGQKLYTAEARRVYLWALDKFPKDRSICLHVAQAALQHHAEDEPAQRFYEAALKFHPPFAKDLYQHLHYIFHRQKKYDESFQTLKQALYLEKSGADRLVTRLTELGWRYDRQQELLMTLQFLLGHNEGNPTIRRCLAFSLAHIIIRHHGKQKPTEVNLPYGSESDLQMLQTALPNPASLTGLDLVRDYCTLQLALLAAPRPNKNLAAAPARQGSYTTITPKAFEYHSLLDAQPLEEVLAGSPSAPATAKPALEPTTPENNVFDWQRDFLKRLPAVIKTEKEAVRYLPAVTSNGTDQVQPHMARVAVLILSPAFPHENAEPPKTASASPSPSMPKTIELVTQHLVTSDSSIQVYALSDGILAISPHTKILADVAIALFKKISRYNILVPEKNQIALRAALHTLPESRLALMSPESSEENNLAGLELLYDGLHLLQAEREGAASSHLISPVASSRLLLSRKVFETLLSAENCSAKYWGRSYWGAPGWHDEVCEIIWYNPLDYASEKKPYTLGRFLVIEKIHEQPTYGTYRSRDRSLERPVILKALHPAAYLHQQHDEAQQAEMVHAIRRLGRLEHPGMALLYDMGTHEDFFYFAREYIEGENLAQILAGQQRLAPVEIIRLLIEVCRILRSAHQNGVYHGNLKPANIWRMKAAVTKEPVYVRALLAPPPSQAEKIIVGVKISDFFIPGFTEITETGWLYVPPERLFPKNGEKTKTFSATVDVYALGIILYESLGGENHFKALRFPVERTAWEKVQLSRLAPNHHAAGEDLWPALDEIIRRATGKNPVQRYQTVDELEVALRQALKDPAGLIKKK